MSSNSGSYQNNRSYQNNGKQPKVNSSNDSKKSSISKWWDKSSNFEKFMFIVTIIGLAFIILVIVYIMCVSCGVSQPLCATTDNSNSTN